MHFIQNTWFASNVMFVLFFCLLCLSAVAYMNNRIRIYKKSMYSAVVVFLLALGVFVNAQQHQQKLSFKSLGQIQTDKTQVEAPSIFSRIADLVLDIVRHKVSE